MKDRILILGTEVTDDVANVLVAQMLYLANADPTADITLYINSPGGSVQAGLAIFDTMQVSIITSLFLSHDYLTRRSYKKNCFYLCSIFHVT